MPRFIQNRLAAGAAPVTAAVVLAASAAGEILHVEVAASPSPRVNAVVCVQLPADFPATRLFQAVPVTPPGTPVPVQIEPGPPPRAWWIVPGELPAGEHRVFELRPGAVADAVGVRVVETPEALLVKIGEHRVLRYNKKALPPPRGVPAKFARSGYIHPVWTPAGRVVTDDFPPDHRHHHGVWFPWTKTEFEGRHPDFWNLGGKTGTVRFTGVLDTVAGPVFGGFRVRHEHVDLSAPDGERIALSEVWTVRVWNVVGGPENSSFVWDIDSVQQCVNGPIHFPRYRYGGIGFRGARQWLGPNCFFLTSTGRTRKDGHATRARWCDVSGPLDGGWAGAVILCHPTDFRFPQPMRIHPTQPFFNFAPSQAGDWSMVPGREYRFRYRFMVHDQKVIPKAVERVWEAFSQPPLGGTFLPIAKKGEPR